jgi:hypothetical protein
MPQMGKAERCASVVPQSVSTTLLENREEMLLD